MASGRSPRPTAGGPGSDEFAPRENGPAPDGECHWGGWVGGFSLGRDHPYLLTGSSGKRRSFRRRFSPRLQP